MTPSNLFTQARSFWQEASTPTRATIAGGGAFLLILAIALTFWAATPEFVRIYSGSPTEAQSIAREMDKEGIPYRISDDGGALSVQQVDAGRARQVAGGAQGTKESARGLRGLESLGPFTTYEQQRARIELAHEEEIEQALGRYAGVQQVAVNLALAADNARVGDDAPPKAAINLTPTPGTTFDEAQIAAMAHVVANSVPGLTPENVTIASTEGVALWTGTDDSNGPQGGMGALRTRTKAEKEFVRARQAELQASLDRAFGAGKTIVYVDAVLDLDKQESTAKRFIGGGEDGRGLPVSKKTATEHFTGADSTTAAGGGGGVTGTDSNTPPSYRTASGASGRGAGSYKSISETENFQNSEENVHTIKTVGEPKRLNVSVMVDQALSPGVRAAVRDWVQGSVVNPGNAATTRVTVVDAPFDTSRENAAQAARKASELQAWHEAYARYIILPLIFVILLVGAWLLTRRKGGAHAGAPVELPLPGGNRPAMEGRATGAPLPGTRIEDILAGDSAAATALLPEADEEFVLPQTRMKRIQEKIEPELEVVVDFINKRPETAALLLRTWTTSDKE